MCHYLHMNIVLSKLNRFLNQLRGFFPSSLPSGMTEFNAWSDSLASTYTLPTQDVDSVRFSLASIIMHLGPSSSHVSKYYFYKMLKAAAAKQVAGAAFYEIKQAQQAKAAAAAQVASNEQPG